MSQTYPIPHQAKIGHIIPDLKGYSLVLLVQMCKVGCNVTIPESSLHVKYNNKIVLQRHQV
jgi:hypothetical protein